MNRDILKFPSYLNEGLDDTTKILHRYKHMEHMQDNNGKTFSRLRENTAKNVDLVCGSLPSLEPHQIKPFNCIAIKGLGDSYCNWLLTIL